MGWKDTGMSGRELSAQHGKVGEVKVQDTGETKLTVCPVHHGSVGYV